MSDADVLRVEERMRCARGKTHGSDFGFAAAALRACTQAEPTPSAVTAYLDRTRSHVPWRTRDVRAWDAWFLRLRWVCVAQQALCAVACVVGSGAVPTRVVVVLSTLAELAQWAGHCWCWRPGRTLPLWTVLPDRMAAWFEGRVALHLALLGTLIAALCAALVWERALVWALLVLVCVAALDAWRLLYIHYWLLALAGCWLPNTSLTLALVLGPLYAFSGYAKLVSPLFHAHTAPRVFEAIYSFLRVESSRARRALSHLGVLGEALLGAAVLARPWLPRWMQLATGAGSVAMHAYIVAVLGWRTGVRTFVSWNFMCAALCWRLAVDAPALGAVGWHHAVVAAIMLVPPLVPRWRHQYPTLAHAYFVPSSRRSLFVFPLRAVHRIPLCENGRSIVVGLAGSADHTAAAAGPHEAVLSDSCEWADSAFCYGGTDDAYDPCNEYFSHTATSFWAMIARRVIGDPRACRVVEVEE